MKLPCINHEAQMPPLKCAGNHCEICGFNPAVGALRFTKGVFRNDGNVTVTREDEDGKKKKEICTGLACLHFPRSLCRTD